PRRRRRGAPLRLAAVRTRAARLCDDLGVRTWLRHGPLHGGTGPALRPGDGAVRAGAGDRTAVRDAARAGRADRAPGGAGHRGHAAAGHAPGLAAAAAPGTARATLTRCMQAGGHTAPCLRTRPVP